ncbi:hypothetical protein [Microvirga solisilvae]|uniref:hypothetical protein n=1 Tax=Microvirga solisilvae TaxID=2919498 RepID=UPI001FB003CD|nr:hypothetical protein [Microvirga solisilvae]
MKTLHRAGVCALALVAGAAALQIEPAAVRNLVVEQAEGHVSIGSVRVPLWSAAFAQSADSFALENVKVSFGGVSYEAKRIEFSGVTSPRADIEAIFSGSSSEPLAARLARISAKQISAPELIVSQKTGSSTQSYIYKNVVASDIVEGRVASTTSSAAALRSDNPKDDVVISYGQATVSDFDLPALMRLYEVKAENTLAPLSRIYGTFSIDNVEVSEGGKGFTFKIARVEGRDFMARPTLDSWMGTSTLLVELGDKENLTPEEDGKVMAAVADLLSSFDLGLMEAKGIDMKIPQEKGLSPLIGRIERIAYTGTTGGQPADFRMEGMAFSDNEGRMQMDTLSLTGFSIAPTLNGMLNLKGKSLTDLDPDTARTLVPTLGTLRLSGVDLDFPDKSETSKSKKNQKAKPERIKAAFKDFEFTANKPINGVPTNFRVSLQNLAMALPAKSDDEFLKELLAMGYKNVDVSYAMAASWNEATNEIVIQEASSHGQDIGSLNFTGLIGNVSKDVFSTDKAKAAEALMAAKAKSIDIVVEDKGVFGRYLAKAAKAEKKSPEALRKSYSRDAGMLIAALVGNEEHAKVLSDAVSRFIDKPGKLTISVTPKNPTGFGVMDAMMASDHDEMLDKLNISAKTE